MALPAQKRSISRKKRRQYQFRLKKYNYTFCPNCQEPIKPHSLCPKCGYYKNKQIIKIKEKTKKEK